MLHLLLTKGIMKFPSGAKGTQRRTNMNTYHFDTTADAYDACQWNEDIKFGDVLIIESERVVGVADVWPLALTENTGELHGLTDRSEAGLKAYIETRKAEIESLFNKVVDVDVEVLLSLLSQDKETNNR